MSKVTVTGNDIFQFLDYFEDQQENGRYQEVESKEVVEPSDESTGDANIVSIILSGLVSTIGTLVIDYLNRYKKNEISFDLENDRGGKMSVTLKNMSLEEVREAMREFMERT